MEVPLLCNLQAAQWGERRNETSKQQVGRSAPGAPPDAVKAGKGLASCREGALLAAATPHCSHHHGAAWNLFIYFFE